LGLTSQINPPCFFCQAHMSRTLFILFSTCCPPQKVLKNKSHDASFDLSRSTIVVAEKSGFMFFRPKTLFSIIFLPKIYIKHLRNREKSTIGLKKQNKKNHPKNQNQPKIKNTPSSYVFF